MLAGGIRIAGPLFRVRIFCQFQIFGYIFHAFPVIGSCTGANSGSRGELDALRFFLGDVPLNRMRAR